MAQSVVIVLGAEPLDAAALAARVVSEECGALVTMVGLVRRRSDDGRSVSGMAYESYDEMAVREMREIAEEARTRWPECHLAIAHRVGNLAIGEASVVVAVASPHRAQAFDACEYCIDEVKRRVEVWKQEHYADGAAPRWLGNSASPR